MDDSDFFVPRSRKNASQSVVMSVVWSSRTVNSDGKKGEEKSEKNKIKNNRLYVATSKIE